jgi:endogenous inhibitor of DNA gyrase (YacG/DUF329 family)
MTRATPCPICKSPADPAFRPFCSKRCADVDLGRWLSGRYVVPGDNQDAEDDERGSAPPPPSGDEEE